MGLIEELVIDNLRKILKLSDNQNFDKDQGFFELGIDSMTAVELSLQIQKAIGNAFNFSPNSI